MFCIRSAQKSAKGSAWPANTQFLYDGAFHGLQLEDEWSSIHWEKVEYMTRIGLRPW